MHFILATIPIRAVPTPYPPVGSTTLLDMLIREGYNPKFYDINAIRPDFEEVINFFRKEQADIVGISAVVSTSYGYTKKLTHAIKRVSPKTKIILGGCLAASAEILLRKCPIDICVVGEGEKVLLNLVKHWERFGDFDPHIEDFQTIKGISSIDPKGDFIFTGYEKQSLPEELAQPNYNLLAEYSDIHRYIYDPMVNDGFLRDSRSYQSERRGQKCCFVMTGKGCVSRCTFCHRWLKGYRSYPVGNIINTMKALREKFNVGFFIMGDESFGADPRMLEEFIKAVKPLDILFKIGGMRVSTAYRNPGLVRKLKESGCAEMIFGMESGSDKILAIMEKGVTRKENLEVAKLLVREGMCTTHQLVIGMPGENDDTINDTIECVKAATEDMDDYPAISTNYFQALPGTPGYEFMREKGLIGKTLEEEEAYLLNVSDINAGSRAHYNNISEEPISKVFLWQHKIRVEVAIHWYRRHNWKSSNKTVNPARQPGKIRNVSISSLVKSLTTKKVYFRIVSLMGNAYWALMLFFKRMRIYGLKKAIFFTFGVRPEEDRSRFIIGEVKSIRKLITQADPKTLSVSEANMLPLRRGR